MKYTNHSGGCEGADMAWELAGEPYDVHTIAYSFKGHKQYGKHPYVMTNEELGEGWASVLRADQTLNRNVLNLRSDYVRQLLCRNWFQVKHADTVFAVGKFAKNCNSVAGGTGWAVQMAIDISKPVFFFDQKSCGWYKYLGEVNEMRLDRFVAAGPPTLTEQFAGIGTRELSDDGLQAILDCYTHTFT